MPIRVWGILTQRSAFGYTVACEEAHLLHSPKQESLLAGYILNWWLIFRFYIFCHFFLQPFFDATMQTLGVRWTGWFSRDHWQWVPRGISESPVGGSNLPSIGYRSLRKHPFLLALRRWGRSQRRRARRNGCFRRLSLPKTRRSWRVKKCPFPSFLALPPSTQQSFPRGGGGSARRSNPSSFHWCAIFDRKGTPYVYLPLTNVTT